MKLPILPCAEKLELVLSTAPIIIINYNSKTNSLTNDDNLDMSQPHAAVNHLKPTAKTLAARSIMPIVMSVHAMRGFGHRPKIVSASSSQAQKSSNVMPHGLYLL